MPKIIVIAHNIRSTHNVGSIFRSCEGFGVERIIFSGYSPYPTLDNDARLPHIAAKLTQQIHKSALDAEKLVPFSYYEHPPIDQLRHEGYRIVALEQNERSISLPLYTAPNQKIVLILGEEVHGIAHELLEQCDDIIEIPMVGQKESFNVSVATGIALYGLMSVS